METAPIVTSIVGTGIAIIGLAGLMARMLWTGINRQFDAMNRQFDAMERQFDAMNRQFAQQFQAMNQRLDTVDSRLDHLETRLDDTNKRIDTISRDIADLRDRTGALEGALSAFMNAGRSPNAA
ncbi:MAG: hypothetical protein OXH75_27305 [Acidobacteria bacterium]|nr:hypothetical protein [Acidobacteriota bacterium]